MTTEHLAEQPTEHPTPYDAAPSLEALLADLTVAVRELNQTVTGLQALLAPLAATQQVGDQLKAASQAASQVAGVAGMVASAAVKRGVAAGKGLTQRP